MSSVRSLIKNESGATAIEYALIASMIALAIVTGLQLAGAQISTVFAQVGNALN